MSYVKHILLPGEQVVYESHVHPKVLVFGMFILGISAYILYLSDHTGQWHSYLLAFAYWLANHAYWTAGFYEHLARWQQASPGISLEIKVLVLGLALWGFSKLARGLVLMQATELVVTDRRIIAKVGLMTIVTLEMDKRRVAGVMIDQSLWGRFMGYGHIFIQGYTSSIGGLPAMVHPHTLEKFVMPDPA